MTETSEQIQPKPPIDRQQTLTPAAQLGAWTDLSGATGNIFELIKEANTSVTLDQLITMRRKDGYARALMQLVLLPLRYSLQNGRWESPEPFQQDSREEVDYANLMWSLPKTSGGMSQPITKVIRQALLSVTDGFAPFEVVYDTAKKGPLKGKYIIKKLSYCDPRTVTIVVDKDGGYNGFKQETYSLDGRTKKVHVKPDHSLVFTYQDELNPYYGVSMLESAYPHYEIRRKLYYIAHLAAQFAAVPGRMGIVPRNATPQQIHEFKAGLSNFAFNTSMVFREGFQVEAFNSNSAFNFLQLIDHHKNMMAKSILATFFDSDDRLVMIENATQDASADLFMLTLETIAEDFASVVSDYLMPKFIDWNFGTKVYPRFVPAKLTDSNKQAIIEMFRNFAVSGVLNCTPELVREMEKKVSKSFGIVVDYEEIEKREKEAAEQQAMQDAETAQLEPDSETPIVGNTPTVGGNAEGPNKPANERRRDGSTNTSGVRIDNRLKTSAEQMDEIVTMAQQLFAGEIPDITHDDEGRVVSVAGVDEGL